MGTSFASDNYAGVHPEVLAAIASANGGHVSAYGADIHTERAVGLIRDHFATGAKVLFTFNGTGANVIALQLMLRPFEAVLCAQTAHINVDECGAPERFLGSKLVDIPTEHGKLSVEELDAALTGVGDQHRVQPRVVSLTQPTELGTLYSLDHLADIVAWAHSQKMLVHVDGARLANAAVALGAELHAFAELGVDVLSFGGTKNGALGAEAVLLLNDDLAATADFVRKQSMQLASKMRFVAVQFTALLENDLWRRNATNANEMAARLATTLDGTPGLTLTHPVEANAVFARLPRASIEALQRDHDFYVWNERIDEVRWMTSFDTAATDITEFTDAVGVALTGASGQF